LETDILEILKRTTLFCGLGDTELELLCGCLRCYTRRYPAGGVVWLAGDRVNCAGIVLEGSVVAEKTGYGGLRSLAAQHGPAELFGDVLMSSGAVQSPVDILASQKGARIFFVPFDGIMTSCEKHCPCHDAIRLNLLSEISVKFWALRRRIDCLSSPSLRGRLCLLFFQTASDADSDSFSFPFDRGGMASYLGVNRSALSRELSRMREEGLIFYQKNKFRLLDKKRLSAFLD
jgi:CRP-like cAMP-binding protein